LLVALELAELSGSTVGYAPYMDLRGGQELTVTLGGDRAGDDHPITFSENLVGSDPQGLARQLLVL
jgi:hypothetical protein